METPVPSHCILFFSYLYIYIFLQILHIPPGGSEIPRSPGKQCVLLGIAGIQLSELGPN